jgi:hypothetical protein
LESSAHAGAATAEADNVEDDIAARENAAALLEEDEGQQDTEGLSMLMVGFGTGMSIALIFLVYIILEAARLLP